MYWYNIELSNTRSMYSHDANLFLLIRVPVFLQSAYNVFFYHFVNGANNGTWLLVCDAHFTDHHSVRLFFFSVFYSVIYFIRSFFVRFREALLLLLLLLSCRCCPLFFIWRTSPPPLHLSHIHHFRCNLTIGNGSIRTDPSCSYIIHSFLSPAVVSQMIFDARNDMQN